MTPGVQNIILPLCVPPPYGLIQNTSPFFVCLAYLQYITKSMQGNCLWLNTQNKVHLPLNKPQSYLALFHTVSV